MKKHIGTHTGETPHVCNVCEKGFTRPSFLKRHVKTHTGERLFKCSLGQKEFLKKGRMNSHKKPTLLKSHTSAVYVTKPLHQRVP